MTFRWATLILTLLVLAGCSGQDDNGKVDTSNPSGAWSGDAGVDATEQIDLSQARAMPARPLTTEERYVINAAIDRLIARCMQDAGFEWRVVTSRNVPGEVNRYPTLEELNRSGYSADLRAIFSADADANQRFVNDPLNSIPERDKAAYQEAFAGGKTLQIATPEGTYEIPVEGCAPEANRQVYGSDENAFWLQQVIEVGAGDNLSLALARDNEYIAALRPWQDCMRSRGVSWMDGKGSWKDWDNGFAVLRQKMALDGAVPAQALQERVAADDAACLQSSKLYEVRKRLLPKVKKKIWDQAAMSEHDKWQLQQLALANAKTIP